MRRERTYVAQPFELMQSFYREAHDPLIRCEIDLGSHVDVSLLRDAVGVSIAAAPLVSCVFDERTGRWIETGCDATDVVRVIDANGDPSLTHSELLRPLDHHAGPRMRVSVVRRDETDSLCVVVDHMLCDGAGFKQYLYLLAGIYTAMEGGSDGLDLVRGYSLRRDLGQVTQNLGARNRLRAVLSKGAGMGASPTPQLLSGNGPAEAHLIRVTVAASSLSTAANVARATGATINDLLLAAYARALHKRAGCTDIILPCPVDLRRFGHPGQSFGICNLTANYFCHLAIRDDEDFGEVLADVAGQMRGQKESLGCLQGPLLFHAIAHVLPRAALRRAFFASAGVPVVSYTNLGILDEGRLTFGSTKTRGAFIATATKRPPSFQLSASTFRGTCTLTSCLYADESDLAVAEGVLGDVRDEIVRFS